MTDDGKFSKTNYTNEKDQHFHIKDKNGSQKVLKLIISDNNKEYHEKPTIIATPTKHNIEKKKKKKRRDKSDLGDNFVAPDGGWGWLVAIASGVNIVRDTLEKFIKSLIN